MRVVMIGGTGFLGYFACRELIARGHQPIAVGLHVPAPGSMPDGCKSVVLDCDRCSDAELWAVLSGADAVIHAAGADGRNSFPAPAIIGFRAANVEPIRRLLSAMKQVGARRLVILGSYYTALARQLPHLGILRGNAYPVSRQEQADLAMMFAPDQVDVAILELPYIFGAAPGRGTLWGYLIDKVAAAGPVAVPGGGTACITASQVAAAAAGAIERPHRGHRHFPLAGENLTYQQIYGHFADALGLRAEFVASDPAAGIANAEATRARLNAANVETGYDPVAVARWQNIHLNLDPLPAMEALGFGPDDMAAAIHASVVATRAHGGAGPASLSGNSQ